jgi:hypothetical protein
MVKRKTIWNLRESEIRLQVEMREMIEFDAKGNWDGVMKIPSRLLQPLPPKKWLSLLFVEINDVKTKYIAFRSNDGVLLGQEKANLINELYEVASGLFYFYHQVLGTKNSVTDFSEETVFYGFNVRITDRDWQGSGYIKYRRSDISQGMAGFFQDQFMPKIKTLLQNYAEVGSEKKENSQEVKAFTTTLQECLFHVLIMIHALQTKDFDR